MITVAIHTFDRATKLKQLLEYEGVKATLQNVNLDAPAMSAGVRVRIAESDLPLALRIIENPEIFHIDNAPDEQEPGHTVLVPIDFSDRSIHAAKVAFAIARNTKSRLVLLHAYLVPHTNPLTSLGASLNLDGADSAIEETETAVEIAKTARDRMEKLSREIRAEIKHGTLPAAKFSTVLLEGLPEECIGEYVKSHPQVHLLVMGTRAAEQKAADLAGSITAEVLDNCRIQALTIPECDTRLTSIESIRSIALLSHLEQEDFLTLDAIHRLLPEDISVSINVVCMPNDRYSQATNEAARTALREYCNEHYPHYTFLLTEHDKKKAELETGDVDLMVVPNRKKNILQRLFNPGAAHRILFHSDLPLLVIPV